MFVFVEDIVESIPGVSFQFSLALKRKLAHGWVFGGERAEGREERSGEWLLTMHVKIEEQMSRQHRGAFGHFTSSCDDLTPNSDGPRPRHGKESYSQGSTP